MQDTVLNKGISTYIISPLNSIHTLDSLIKGIISIFSGNFFKQVIDLASTEGRVTFSALVNMHCVLLVYRGIIYSLLGYILIHYMSVICNYSIT